MTAAQPSAPACSDVWLTEEEKQWEEHYKSHGPRFRRDTDCVICNADAIACGVPRRERRESINNNREYSRDDRFLTLLKFCERRELHNGTPASTCRENHRTLADRCGWSVGGSVPKLRPLAYSSISSVVLLLALLSGLLVNNETLRPEKQEAIETAPPAPLLLIAATILAPRAPQPCPSVAQH